MSDPAAPAAIVFDVGEVLIDEARVWETWAHLIGVTPLTFAAVLGAVIARDPQAPPHLILRDLDELCACVDAWYACHASTRACLIGARCRRRWRRSTAARPTGTAMPIAQSDTTSITATPLCDVAQRHHRVEALAGVGAWQWRPHIGDMRWSPYLRRMFGVTTDESLDIDAFRDLMVTHERAGFDHALTRAVDSRSRFDRVQRMCPRGGHTVRVVRINGEVLDEDGSVTVLATVTDITDEQNAKENLAHLANHDPLTGLYNRRGILAVIAEHVARRPARPAALLLIDVDDFKDTNDLHGHATGDEVLRRLSGLLVTLLPGAATGRLGGDEFAVVLDDHDADAARAAAELLCNEINGTPITTTSGSLRSTVSIGLTMLTATNDTEAALADADLALYEAKAAGRNCVRVALSEQHTRARRKLSVQQRLADALRSDQLMLMAQPIVDLRTDEVSAWELLLRLCDGNEPKLPPKDFLPTAERSELARRVDRWVVERAIQALSTRAARRRGLCVHVNVTSRSLDDGGFGAEILTALRDAGVSPHRLGLEISEAATMVNVSAVRDLVTRLGNAGCPIVVDDFGVRLGSLVSLHDVPFAAVKVAGPLVAQADHGAPNTMVVDGIVQLARGLGMQVIAEEVDRQALLDTLRDARVQGAQGYVLGAPRPLDEMLATL